MISAFLISVPGAILFIPIPLIAPVSLWISLFTLLVIFFLCMKWFRQRIQKDHISGLSLFIIATLLYWEALWIFLSTNCFYKKNRWDKCIKYAFQSEYCPHFTFDYSFDAWILLIKWLLFK